MKINLSNENSSFDISFNDKKFNILFYSTPQKFVIEKNFDKYLCAIKQNINAYIYESKENLLLLDFNKESEYARLISFKISYDAIEHYDSNQILFGIGDQSFKAEVQDGSFDIDDEGIILLTLIGKSTKVYIYPNLEKNIFQSLTINETQTSITETSYMPEFSIACFDDSDFVFPRQIRYGQPVISTVPANISSTSSQADTDFYNQGLGPNYKTIYFRIISNKIIESLSANDLSDLKLKIYMPNGLDTVKAAQYVNMYFVSSDTTNNISIYKAQFDFYTQGNFNGIDYVDGLMYFDVQVPLTMQSYMPFQFDFSL